MIGQQRLTENNSLASRLTMTYIEMYVHCTN